MSERMWGRVVRTEKRTRVVSLVFAITAIVAMSFCQLGFWCCGVVAGHPVYLLLLLAPLFMGAFLFGPITGALLGLFAGVVVFVHAQVFPLDFYEVYFMTPTNTFVLLTLLGALAGWLYDIALRRCQQGVMRAGMIVVVSVILSLVTSLLVQGSTMLTYSNYSSIEVLSEVLQITPLGTAVQVLVDAVLIALLCLIADAIMRRILQQGESGRKLLTVFSSWMLAISLIVFMASCAIIFSVTTKQAQDNAYQKMEGEIQYLERQLSMHDNSQIAMIISGYDLSHDGVVVVTNEYGTIIASDDQQHFAVGSSFLLDIGYDFAGIGDEGVQEYFNAFMEDDESLIQAFDKDTGYSMDFVFLSVGAYDDGYIALMYSSDRVYADRFNTMLAATLLAIALIVAIALVASRLLSAVVIRRIDETNDSLMKITEGDLNERVRVQDSCEFTSLSSGINTTVEALKDTIDEVEQRNVQELLTAKAIQESALPTEFPAFPEIDRFDIYASMKTAKEVGGDFYDFFEIGNTTKLGFIMADVSGKGIPAALFMMTAKTQIRNFMEADLPIGEAVDAANHQLCIGNDAGMFVTAWMGTLDYETGELVYVNAGHNPPLLLHDGKWEWVRNVSGMPLGLFDGIPYDSYKIQLELDDMLYTYTDGVTEAMDVEDNLFSEERLEKTLNKYAEFNPRSVCVGVRRAITDFTLDCEQSDDITMLCLKYGVPPETKAVMVLKATTDQLAHVCNYIHAELHRRHAPKSVYNPLDIAAEELFVNVCHYAYPDATPEEPGEVSISFEYEPNPPALTVQIIDSGVPYNPLEKPDAVTPDDIMAVPIGGLGILVAKKSVDEMWYERVSDSNVLSFRKSW